MSGAAHKRWAMVYWPGMHSGSNNIPRGNKIWKLHILGKCEQTLPDSTFGLMSSKTGQCSVNLIIKTAKVYEYKYIQLSIMSASFIYSYFKACFPRTRTRTIWNHTHQVALYPVHMMQYNVWLALYVCFSGLHQQNKKKIQDTHLSLQNLIFTLT